MNKTLIKNLYKMLNSDDDKSNKLANTILLNDKKILNIFTRSINGVEELFKLSIKNCKLVESIIDNDKNYKNEFTSKIFKGDPLFENINLNEKYYIFIDSSNILCHIRVSIMQDDIYSSKILLYRDILKYEFHKMMSESIYRRRWLR